MNVVNRGLHAGNNLHIQEYLIIPKCRTFKESIDVGAAIYHALGAALVKAKGSGASNLGDEGGFAPNFKNDLEPLRMIRAVAKKLHLDKKIDLGVDAAATDVKGLSRQQLSNTYRKLIKEYSPLYIEDPFGENDFKNFAAFTAAFTAAQAGGGKGTGTKQLDRGRRSYHHEHRSHGARAREEECERHHHQAEPDRDDHGSVERRAPGARISLGGRRIASAAADER